MSNENHVVISSIKSYCYSVATTQSWLALCQKHSHRNVHLHFFTKLKMIYLLWKKAHTKIAIFMCLSSGLV